MDITRVSRQHYTTKKGNKENVQPAQEIKSFVKQKAPSGPLQPKGDKKETLTKTSKAVTNKQMVRNQLVGEQALKNTTTFEKSTNEKKTTHSHSIKAEQATKLKKQVGEGHKPPTASQPPRPAPGMYKGKIVESKIGSIWKSSVAVSSESLKSTVRKPASQRTGNMTKSASTSASGRGTQTSASILNKSVKPAVNSHPPKAFSACPPARSVPIAARPRNSTVVQSKRCGTLIAKPKVPVTDKNTKPPLTSTISQFRTNSETAEEKRAKLAVWLASKGKTLKRPAMGAAAPSTKSKVSTKPGVHPKSQMKSQHAPNCKLEPEVKENKPALSADNQEVVNTETRTSLIMNTTLDLLENSALDLSVEPQDSGMDRVDEIVINLCDALEALETPSKSNNDLQLNEENNEVDSELKRECNREEIPDDEKVKSEGSISDDSVGDNQEVQDEIEESDEDCNVKENTPPMKGASVVKYSVKTTPFLQNVKKTIEDEVCTSTSKRKSNIKDIKFLTPVRRSSRIHRQSSRLPLMLVDHDPCVSSLAELVKLDDDAHAYIYRKNPALLEDLPDQP